MRRRPERPGRRRAARSATSGRWRHRRQCGPVIGRGPPAPARPPAAGRGSGPGQEDEQRQPERRDGRTRHAGRRVGASASPRPGSLGPVAVVASSSPIMARSGGPGASSIPSPRACRERANLLTLLTNDDLRAAAPPRRRVPDAGRIPTPPRRGGVAAACPRAAGSARGFVAMRHPNYRRYWFGQIGSLVGAWMQSVALPWLVLQLGGSPLQLGLVMAFLFGPSMFLAPLGGVLADRVDKRRTLLAVNAWPWLQAATLFVLAVHRLVEIWHDLPARPRGRLRQRGRDAGPPGVRRRARAARGPRQRASR